MNTQTLTPETEVSTASTPTYQKILVVLGMMTLVGGTLTGVMTYMSVGYSSSFTADWLTSFLTAACTIMPMGFFIMAMLTKGAEKFLPRLSEKSRNIVIGFAMALIMESGMAFTTAFNTIGFEHGHDFLWAWMNGLLGALPVALVLMTAISLTIKPKVERFLKS
ncbi:DUF2798 domain-containing protein [Vibrio amylolyticus]|uniref:DUF2798 domain-containing protein n=1 Tax=Vibrio amylolyticus TaxID=2847292 RepID=UPI00354EF5D0